MYEDVSATFILRSGTTSLLGGSCKRGKPRYQTVSPAMKASRTSMPSRQTTQASALISHTYAHTLDHIILHDREGQPHTLLPPQLLQWLSLFSFVVHLSSVHQQFPCSSRVGSSVLQTDTPASKCSVRRRERGTEGGVNKQKQTRYINH